MTTLRKTITMLAVTVWLVPLVQNNVASARSANPISVNRLAQPMWTGQQTGGGKPAPTPTPRPKPIGPPKSGDE